jgi:protein TonB
VHVDAKGMVEEIEVLQGLPMGLTKEATNAVKRWKFQPATQNGLPVSAVIELRINFSPP